MLKFLNALVLLPVLTSAQSIEIFDISPNQVASKIFYLNDKSDLEIEAVVGEYQSTSDLFSTCWILNKTTHQVAWEFSRRKAKRIRSHQSLSLKEAITLAAGYYQVYYALNPQRNIAHKKIF